MKKEFSDREVLDAILYAVELGFDEAAVRHASGKYSHHPAGSPKDHHTRSSGYHRWTEMKKRAKEIIRGLRGVKR